MAILAAALAAEQDAEKMKPRSAGDTEDTPSAAAEWYPSVPPHTRGVFKSEAHADPRKTAMLALIRKRFSSLVVTPIDQIDNNKCIVWLSVDSMIASELRIWFWNTLKVDVPFLDLLSADKSLATVDEFAEEKLLDV